MNAETSFEDLPPMLAGAMARRGFTSLTPIQQAVLEPAVAGHDLRLASQTGSGKTVAIGLVLARDLDGRDPTAHAATEPTGTRRAAQPAALVVAPTRELAAQLNRELSWLLQPSGVACCSVTGGTSFPAELRALAAGATIVIGTPGRMRDHLERGSIEASHVSTVILDEADQMLDMGFREELEAILDRTPTERRVHMASATFPREAQQLAARYQRDPRQVVGSPPGEANHDITHVAHVVRTADRLAALINLLLLAPSERTLVFVRTRADASALASELEQAGFSARPLSGDLEQAARTRTLDAFRSGSVNVLVATDVAARGLDIPDVGRVVHVDPPGDAEAFTHRSGRTGRAGRKGRSVVLVPPSGRESITRMALRARLQLKWERVPTAKQVQQAADERLIAELSAAEAGEGIGTPRELALAARLVATHEDPVALVAALLARTRHAGPCAPRDVANVPAAEGPKREPRRGCETAPRGCFVAFRMNWGTRNGADARRLLATVCRRGHIEGREVGAIRLGERWSTFEVAAPVAEEFAQRVRKPDARDPHLRIERLSPTGLRYEASHKGARRERAVA